ncbi:NMT1/THI5 like protein [uncultured archaeon]|nr:NMT1/THI5 like protein [uncultured archaeon]
MEKIVAAIGVIATLVLLGFGTWYFSNSPMAYSPKPESITVGAPAIETNAIIYVADDLGYFKKNGLNVTFKTYDSGGAAVHGLLRNETELALASEFVMVNNILKNGEVRTFGNIDKFENMFLIARKDRGIGSVFDLRNRRIGVPRGTIADFYLGRYLNLHNMELSDVTLVNIRPDNSSDALAAGDVDAVVTWHPYLDEISNRYGDRVIVCPIQSSQLTYWNIISRTDWTGLHQGTVDRFLRSVAQAEEYTTNRPQETKAILQKKLNYTDAYMAAVWPDHQFSISLDQSLVLAMEDEGRWMIKNNLSTVKTIPNFREYIYMKGLEKMKPESVNIIR